MKETVISWTIVNWITVFLMVVIGSLVLGTGLKLITNKRPSND